MAKNLQRTRSFWENGINDAFGNSEELEKIDQQWFNLVFNTTLATVYYNEFSVISDVFFLFLNLLVWNW